MVCLCLVIFLDSEEPIWVRPSQSAFDSVYR